MKEKIGIIYSGLIGIIHCCVMIIFSIIAFVNFILSNQVENLWKYNRIFSFKGALVKLVVVLVFYIVIHKVIKFFDSNIKELILLSLVIFSSITFCFLLILYSKSFPSADSASVLMVAEGFANNLYDAISQETSYLRVCPHQLGLAVFFEWIYSHN